jgi:hypothetical protein
MQKNATKTNFLSAIFSAMAQSLRSLFQSSDNREFNRLKDFITS